MYPSHNLQHKLQVFLVVNKGFHFCYKKSQELSDSMVLLSAT